MNKLQGHNVAGSPASPAPCFLCGESDFLSDGRFPPGTWGLRRCQSCGLVCTHPFPTIEEQLAENERKYGKSFLSMQAGYHNCNRKMHVSVLSEIEKESTLDGRRLLDIGCGAGQFLSSALDCGWEAEGVELNKENVAAIVKNRMSVFQGTLEEAQFSDNTFDVVTLWDILEHIPNPIAFLAEVFRILRPGGLLFLQSPNIESDIAVIWGDRWPWLCLPDHLYHFSPSTIEMLFIQAGFSTLYNATWESITHRLKAIANRKANASKTAKFLRIVVGCGPVLLSHMTGSNLKRMGLIRVLARKEGL